MNKLLNGERRHQGGGAGRHPSLISGSAESAKFDVALADYRKVVDRCQLQVP